MNIRKLLLISAAILGFAGQAAAQVTDQVTVARVTGTVTATLPDGSSAAVKAGDKLSQGTKIVTGDKSEAYLVSHGDTTTAIVANSEVSIAEISTTGSGGNVTKQTTTLDLKSGNIVAKLNPAKKSVNNYSVRTPKGVAAARGTVFTVTYNNQTYSITVVNGSVSFTSPTDGAVVSIAGGQVRVNGNVEPISGQSGAGAALTKNELAVVAATLAVAAANNIGGTTTAEFQAVVQTIIAAAPEAASTIAALVAVSAPSMSAIVEQAVQQAPPPSTPPPSTPPPAPETPITTPQPIDPATVSRSGEE